MTVTRSLSLPAYRVELIGDWDKVESLLANLDKTVLIGAKAGQISASNKLIAIIKKNIRENGSSIGWEPVSDKYRKKKEARGYDPDNLLVMTGLYYRSISNWSTGLNHYVGIKKGVRHPKKNGKKALTLSQIAMILEHGSITQNIKARPLWRPSYKQFGGNLRLKGLLVWHIRNQIYLRHQVRAKITF